MASQTNRQWVPGDILFSTFNHTEDCCCDDCAATGRLCPNEANTTELMALYTTAIVGACNAGFID